MKKLSILFICIYAGNGLQAAQVQTEEEAIALAIARSEEDAAFAKALEESAKEAELLAQAKAQAQEESKKKKTAGSFTSLPTTKIDLTASIQEGADCAYDATKNCVLTVKWLDHKFGTLSQAKFEKDYLQNLRHFPLERLHKAIKEKRRSGSVEFLDNEEVENIILPLLTEGFIPKARIPQWFTVIPNITEASENLDYIMIMEDWVNAIKKIRNSDTAVHGFIINDAREVGKATGHWIAVAVHKLPSDVRYYVIDSMAGYKEKYKDMPTSEIKALETETRTRVDALIKIIKTVPV